jgi:hypothetical protein
LELNEELPLYILDLGGTLLVLFGQWLYDPHTLIVSEDSFERWVCDQNFFGKFSMRCSEPHGVVFQVKVEEVSFVQAERLTVPIWFKHLRQYVFFPGHGETLIRDLERADLIEPVSQS